MLIVPIFREDLTSRMTVSKICLMRAKYPQNSPTSITGNLKQKRQHNGHLKLHQNVQVKYKHLQMEQQRTATPCTVHVHTISGLPTRAAPAPPEAETRCPRRSHFAICRQ
ncbi:hypothetical protein DPMN_087199 [Dreissena polymorpha]|uniref:Uncharacterized protein n=1 Tax=Dreissena polymorpha TaxID=45954 RepID=A0A9D4QVW2_DREPO|nr:hypothetical protein DPMN_087199 [Dreissena polymorpha]